MKFSTKCSLQDEQCIAFRMTVYVTLLFYITALVAETEDVHTTRYKLLFTATFCIGVRRLGRV